MLEKHLDHSVGLRLTIAPGLVFHLWGDSITVKPKD